MGLKKSRPMRNKLDKDVHTSDMFEKNIGNINERQFSKTYRDKKQAGVRD